ncbi:hypothetical protein PF005_g18221 [Phytophthora fragariae]|uniref:Uncharacterized protein n=1 Tax=Phytophthora fragariae TaxID=53985 RepID=A0A6A3WYS6_9STRA|nr:hypothetical protein PF009_g17246 [Phytophthora fragariae]KAE8993387.1 hypothetical protein PF011_g17157 [Phytophthora fragariae]KAE9092713.1 hypothetical protein PF010_g17745 [Phytophthora fragariae]KAE9098237.1 hypothetical protein PF007_g16337 [Phytophthora fragariae]KAE9124029.1 hypothetical protein PF006_g17283 [Phytophthora fragariae]
MEAEQQLRVSGFKRILVRLDEGTRRKYCCRALEEDLQHVKSGLRVCAEAMTQTRQVQDATRKLHASEQAAVSGELLAALETLQTRLETSTNALLLGHVPQNGSLNGSTRRLEKLLPPNSADDKHKKWEKRPLERLEKTLKKMETKWPELKGWPGNLQKLIAEKQTLLASASIASEASVKGKKKRAIPLLDDGETATTSGSTIVAKPKEKTGDSSKDKSKEKTRALLLRCSKEVRTLRDKFELGAYDVNMSRMVTVVDSLWSGFEQSEVVSLTTALFTLVETVDKVVNQAKRQDRLLCLISVLGVVLESPKLQLSTRQKTMVEEYANNCRQSLEQLSRQKESGNRGTEAAKATTPATTSAKAKSADKGAWPKSHVRFN